MAKEKDYKIGDLIALDAEDWKHNAKFEKKSENLKNILLSLLDFIKKDIATSTSIKNISEIQILLNLLTEALGRAMHQILWDFWKRKYKFEKYLVQFSEKDKAFIVTGIQDSCGCSHCDSSKCACGESNSKSADKNKQKTPETMQTFLDSLNLEIHKTDDDYDPFDKDRE